MLWVLKTNYLNESAFEHPKHQLELPRPILRTSLESDHGCTSRIYFDNAGVNVTLTLFKETKSATMNSFRNFLLCF